VATTKRREVKIMKEFLVVHKVLAVDEITYRVLATTSSEAKALVESSWGNPKMIEKVIPLHSEMYSVPQWEVYSL
jgi:hypothetical protein